MDLGKLKKSMKDWSKRFGDTSDEAVIRIAASLARELARKTQPYGVSAQQAKDLRDAVAKDVRKSLRTVDDSYFGALTSGRGGGVRWRGRWLKVAPEMLLRSADEVLAHVNSLRSRQTGKVDKRRVTQNTVRITSKTILEAAIKQKSAMAGLTKGLWLVAGKKATRLARAKKGLGVKTTGWPGRVGEKHARLAEASIRRGLFSPIVTLTNSSPAASLERFLKVADVKKSSFNAFRATLTQYRKAVERMSK